MGLRRRTSEKITLRGMAEALGCLLVAPFVIVFVVIAILFSPFSSLANRLFLWRFRRKHAGRAFLIWTRCRGWREFTVNNLFPVLPDGVVGVEAGFGVTLCREDRRLAKACALSGCCRDARPFVVRVAADGLLVVPLNGVLQELKRCGRRSAEVQRQTAEAINRVWDSVPHSRAGVR